MSQEYSSDDNTKLKSVDEGLNNLILTKFTEAIELYSNQDYNKCYRILKSLYYLIDPYKFEMKDRFLLIIEGIEKHLSDMPRGNVINQATEIRMGQAQYKFTLLLEEMYRKLPKAYAELGKWMQTVKQYNDLDQQISSETFGTDLTLLNEKKEDLKKLSQDKILALMNNNHIHNAHSRWLIENGVK